MNEVTEILTNDEVIETAEEIVKAVPSNGFGKGLAAGVAVAVVGDILVKHVIKPACLKIKNKMEARKAESAEEADQDVEVTYEEVE